jgi:hypothetical protein
MSGKTVTGVVDHHVADRQPTGSQRMHLQRLQDFPKVSMPAILPDVHDDQRTDIELRHRVDSGGQGLLRRRRVERSTLESNNLSNLH